MCNFKELGQHVARAMGQYGHNVMDTFPVQVRLVQPERVKKGVCPLSGQALSSEEMYPRNAATPMVLAFVLVHIYLESWPLLSDFYR